MNTLTDILRHRLDQAGRSGSQPRFALPSLILATALLLTTPTTQASLACFQLVAGQTVAARHSELKVSDRLKDEVTRLESELRWQLSLTEMSAARVAEMKTAIGDLRVQMTWVEKSLWRWLAGLLGGDIKKIDELKSRDRQLKELKAMLDKSQRLDSEADAKVVTEIETWLRANDARFATLRQMEADLNRMVCDGDRCLRKIQEAIGNVNHASTMETVDLFSKNQTMSILSTMATSDANSSAREAERAVKKYIDSVRSLKTKMANKVAEIRSVDDTVDLAVDLIFDFNFDFLSVINLFALDDLRGDLSQMQRQVREIRNKFGDQHRQLQIELNDVVCRVREACRQP